MRFTYSTLLLISSCSVVYAGTACKDTDKVKCCAKPKPLDCVYKTPAEQEKDPTCHCVPKNPFNSQRDEHEVCAWNADSEAVTDYGRNTPCYGFYEDCPATLMQGQPPPKCSIGYPPPSTVMEGHSKEVYCSFDFTKFDVYNVFFTCWLYSCRNRFEKPPETKSTEWCYPPTIMDGSLAKKILVDEGKSTFCEMYTVDNSVEYYDVNKTGTSFCVLPPLCKSGTNTTDTEKFMPTNYMKKGASNMDHCEQLCDQNGDNNGNFINEKPTCRVIPSCDSDNATATFNKFQVPTCLPWCTKDDSYVRSSSNTLRTENYGNNVKHCNPLPICKEGKAPEPPYGPLNPYAATGDNCIPSRVCGQGESKEKYFCEDGGTSEANTEEPPGSAGLSTGAIIGIVVGLVLVLLIIGGLVGLVWYRTLKKRREDDAEWERQKMGGHKVVKEKSAKSGSKKKSATS